MSEHDLGPDPLDKAYAQAEDLLGDEAERAARRARVLGAVAQQASAPAVTPPPVRGNGWQRGAWLVAACVAGGGLFLAADLHRNHSFKVEPPPSAPTASSPVVVAPPPDTSVATPLQRPSKTLPLAVPRPQVPQPHLVQVVPLSPPEAPSASAAAPPPAPAPALAPLPPPRQSAPPPPPPPPPPPRAPSPPRSPGAVSSAPSGSTVSEVVATGSYIRGAPEDASIPVEVTTRSDLDSSASEKSLGASIASLGRNASSGRTAGQPNDQRLANAAGAGQTTEVKVLLDQGVPINAVDADGDTALMRGIQAKRLAVVQLLVRRGASLDLKNKAGLSARDMATALGDPKINEALGLSAPAGMAKPKAAP